MNLIKKDIQFALVREDFLTESALISQYKSKNILLIASGGCTALSLQCLHAQVKFQLVDPNKAQIDLVKTKIKKLKAGKNLPQLFNAKKDDPESLNGCGNFESLFRQFRSFIFEFVYPEKNWNSFFTGTSTFPQDVFKHKYWSVAFDLFFSNPILLAMFGPQAIQHAPPHSYPAHFKKVLEQGLTQKAANSNPYLQNIFIGHSQPLYLKSKVRKFNFDYKNTTIEKVEDFSSFDLISLSNIFDWMDEPSIKLIADLLSRSCKSGSVLLYRQLNNTKDFTPYFEKAFQFDTVLGDELLRKDRSLFYTQFKVGVKK